MPEIVFEYGAAILAEIAQLSVEVAGINARLTTIITQEKKIMTGIADLTTVDTAIDAAVIQLSQSQAALASEVATAVAAIQNLVSGSTDAAVETIAQDLNAQLTAINAAVDANNAATASLTSALQSPAIPSAASATQAIKSITKKA